MTIAAPRTWTWTRRQALALALVPVLLAPVQAAERPVILTLSRQRLLNDTKYSRKLAQAERRMTNELQSHVDQTKRELTAREKELADLRATLPRDQFEALTTAFDRRVRHDRREAQRKAAALQNAFRAERVKLLQILDSFLEKVRADRGADIILNRDNAIAADPKLDITDAVIARFDREVPLPKLPTLDEILSGSKQSAGSPH